MAMNQGSDCPRPPWVASTRELFLRGEFQRLSKPNWDKHLTRKNSLGYSPVRFTSLCHSTHTVHLEGILKEGNDHARFKGKAKLGYETLKGFPVSWWSPCITEDEKNSLTELVLKKDASNHSNDSDDWDDDSFPLCQAKSPAFQLDSSRYGPHGLIVSTSNLLQAFADYWKISTNEIEYRKLGTFSYTREWMYTVLICPPLKKLEATLSERAGQFPELDEEDDVLERPLDNSNHNESLPKWTWRVRASCNFGKWEHLTFAFLLSNEEWPIPPEHIEYVRFTHQNGDWCIPSFTRPGRKCPEAEIETPAIDEVKNWFTRVNTSASAASADTTRSHIDVIVSGMRSLAVTEHSTSPTAQMPDVNVGASSSSALPKGNTVPPSRSSEGSSSRTPKEDPVPPSRSSKGSSSRTPKGKRTADSAVAGKGNSKTDTAPLNSAAEKKGKAKEK